MQMPCKCPDNFLPHLAPTRPPATYVCSLFRIGFKSPLPPPPPAVPALSPISSFTSGGQLDLLPQLFEVYRHRRRRTEAHLPFTVPGVDNLPSRVLSTDLGSFTTVINNPLPGPTQGILGAQFCNHLWSELDSDLSTASLVKIQPPGSACSCSEVTPRGAPRYSATIDHRAPHACAAIGVAALVCPRPLEYYEGDKGASGNEAPPSLLRIAISVIHRHSRRGAMGRLI